MISIEQELQSPLSNRALTCPTGGKRTTFQLVDEHCSGEPYAGLSYIATDSEGMTYTGYLNPEGNGTVENHYAGPIALLFDESFGGSESPYKELKAREHYPLKITELQVRAEETRFLNPDASRRNALPQTIRADNYLQVEVRHLVTHASHLPPASDCSFPVNSGCAAAMGEHGGRGVAIPSRQHTVLEVRALRALRPMLSTDPEFCVLNLYQFALMATLSYCPFGQEPDTAPIMQRQVTFPMQPSIGNWLGEGLAKSREMWEIDANQSTAYYPLYQDVPYSKRLEIVPFDPALYEANSPKRKMDQEHPANVHFLDDRAEEGNATDTQAFITHNDEIILIAIRGTWELWADGLRDADALQVPFQEGMGQVHRGFYEAAQKAYKFTVKYLEKFYAGQTLMICGHSLGGAVALLLSEMLRRRDGFDYTLQLYTYGAPRAGDSTFVEGAAALVHYRMVNHNDPVPSVPGTWMNTNAGVYAPGLALTFANVPAGMSVFFAGITNWKGEAYEHHGRLSHAMPVQFNSKEVSSILWEPGCDIINQHAACSVAVQIKNGLPQRASFIKQLFSAGHHSMTSGYVPACWAALRRWQEALASQNGRLITNREYDTIEQALRTISKQLQEAEFDLRSRARTPAYVEINEPKIEPIRAERYKVRATLDRLASIRSRILEVPDVYGSFARQLEQLAESVPRWRAHPQNQVKEQLAMAPDLSPEEKITFAREGRLPGDLFPNDRSRYTV